MVLSSGIGVTEEMKADAALYVQGALGESLGAFGPIFICVAMCLFAFTTLIGNYSYCEGCLDFIANKKVEGAGLKLFRIVATILIFVGTIASAGMVWNIADMLQGFMVVINVPVIIILMKPAMAALEDYVAQKKAGKDPHFVAREVGLDDSQMDFWK